MEWQNVRRDPRIRFGGGGVHLLEDFLTVRRNRYLWGRALDVSERGIGVELATRIPVGSFVRVRAYGLNLVGSGTVRRFSRRTGGYVLGLELSEALDPNCLAELSALQSGAAVAVS